jgi:hypothetical protein
MQGRKQVGVGVLALVLVITALGVSVLPGASGQGVRPLAANYPPVNGAINGPTTVGELMNVSYTLTATGGPAVAANGTIVGSYTYKANFSAINETGIKLGPATQGVLTNGSITLQFSAPNVVEVVTLSVLFNSTFLTTNATQHVTLQVQIVQPYVLAASLVVGSGAGVQAFELTVLLDGAPVGQIPIVSMTAGTTRAVSFRYVNTNLAPGWHTFSISLANQHGLVTFSGGATTLQQSFYVTPPPPDNTVWYLGGAVAFFGAIFIWTLRVGARRRGKAKK